MGFIMNKTARQGGSVKVFIVMAIILSLIAFGALYGTRRLAMNDQTPPLAVPESSQNKPDESQKSDGESTEKSTAPAQSDKDSKKNQTSTNSGSSSSTSATAGQKLPQSGPAGSFSAIAFTAMILSVVAYIRSLRL